MPPPPPLAAPHIPVGYFRRIGAVAKALVILNLIAVAISLIVLVSQLSVASAADDFLAGQLSSTDFADKIGPFLGLSVLGAGISIAIFVLQCIWSFRMAKNLQLLGRVPQAWKPGWGIGVWFLGGCTLGILPYLMHRELWQGSDPTVPPGDPRWKQSPIGTVLHVWFATQIGAVVLGFIAGLGTANFGIGANRGDTKIAETLRDKLPIVAAAGLFSAAVALLMVAVVRQLSAVHMQATHEA